MRFLKQHTRQALAMLAASALVAGTAGHASAADTLTALGSETLSIQAKPKQDSGKVWVTLFNSGNSDVTIDKISFEALSWAPTDADKALTQNAGITVTDSKPMVVPAGKPQRIEVLLSGFKQLRHEKVEGQLLVRSPETSITRSVTITPAPQPTLPWPQVMFAVALVSLIGLLVTACFRAAAWAKTFDPNPGWRAMLKGRAPGPDWTYIGQATAFTTVAGLLGAVIGAVTLPDVPRQIDKETLVRLNLIFAAVLAVGPFVFQALRYVHPEVPLSGQGAYQDAIDSGIWGSKGLLLFCYSLTGAAAVGEIGSLTLLGWELTDGTGWVVLVVIVGALLGCLALRYMRNAFDGQLAHDWLDEARDKLNKKESGELLKKKHLPLPVRIAEFDGEIRVVPRKSAAADTVPDEHPPELDA
jgi:hypothetical protein